ncbi:MAG: M20/M25/M40 family metallo-hydrolase [Bacteroidales bacterium]|nr:M20/M25/M40 family metallo-hydrolase [Bacteroidales bacterium]
MNWNLYKEILSIDSTSGKERKLAEWLLEHLEAPAKQAMEVGDGTLNLLFSWGTPKVVFCTHLDTVPPYIAPCFGGKLPPEDLSTPGQGQRFPEGTGGGGLVHPRTSIGGGARWIQVPEGDAGDNGRGRNERSEYSPPAACSSLEAIFGRGTCDAKGQIFAMYEACKALEAKGCRDFGLLLLAGEETGSGGAKAFSKTGFEAPFLIVGEPTENKMVSAAKGTLSYDLKFEGKAFHSGYPEFGESAIDKFNEFYNKLKAKDFGEDPELGKTTWNVGLLRSDNPQNILSPEVTCRLYFRTTFVSHEAVKAWMQEMAGHDGSAHGPKGVIPGLTGDLRGGDVPARYVTLPGFESAPVAFGSDAPHLTGFGHKIICGPGSIRFAHRPDEHILPQELEAAIGLYTRLYATLMAGAQSIDS